MDDNKESVCSFSYKLTNKTILSCLRNTGYYTVSSKKLKIEIFILSLVFVVFLFSYFIYGTMTNLFMSLLCILVIASICFVPWYMQRQLIAKGPKIFSQIDVRFSHKTVDINIGTSVRSLIPLTKSNIEEFSDMFIIKLPNKKILPVPFEFIESEKLLAVKDLLKNSDENID